MSALDVLAEHGLTAAVDGDELIITPADCLDDELRGFIRQAKLEILEALRDAANPTQGVPELLLIEKRFTPEELTRIFDGQPHPLTQAEIDYETAYGRVSCLACRHLTYRGACRGRGFVERGYYPLRYEPVMLWRRCDEYRASVELTGRPMPTANQDQHQTEDPK